MVVSVETLMILQSTKALSPVLPGRASRLNKVEVLSQSWYFPYAFLSAFSDSVIRLCVQKPIAI
jgi:hypothetical protein